MHPQTLAQNISQQSVTQQTTQNTLRHIIIQAGGKGTRLEGLTKNKPKCLVPFENLPIIFHLFTHFPHAHFTIIADYKIEVLIKYLAIFATQYNYSIIHPQNEGTISGIKEAIAPFSDNEPFMIIWCDLILSSDFAIPPLTQNYIGISQNFECRWSYVNGECKKEPSVQNGIAGLFIFKNKIELENIAESGAFVRWLQIQKIPFTPLPLTNCKEIGTLLSYGDNNPTPICRPFNHIEFRGNEVIKTAISEQGVQISQKEIAWYKFAQAKGFEKIPQILSFKPLTMKRVQGKNIFEYDCLLPSQRKEILKEILDSLLELHNLVPKIPANMQDVMQTYITKTFERIEKVQSLVAFAENEFIKINGQYYKNILFDKQKIIDKILSFAPSEFCVIHGDCTFSNILFDTFNMRAILIDPRGYFGESQIFGDADYDYAKVYYSLSGDYDQFNRKKFTLVIKENEVDFAIKSSAWQDCEEWFFEYLQLNGERINKEKIALLHALIWLGLSTYAWEDYDSICGAFYNGIIKLKGIL
ncbi:NTP transferase domain-containing protein [Helicobacter himalayensis]|uniref:NTP transferase domain-containing protein n=1 Tax=Helicobacter himalayensis TaxID=1591088 RepID=UPI003D6DAA63